MSNELHNHLHGLSTWFLGGGWLVLVIVAVAATALYVATRRP